MPTRDRLAELETLRDEKESKVKFKKGSVSLKWRKDSEKCEDFETLKDAGVAIDNKVDLLNNLLDEIQKDMKDALLTSVTGNYKKLDVGIESFQTDSKQLRNDLDGYGKKIKKSSAISEAERKVLLSKHSHLVSEAIGVSQKFNSIEAEYSDKCKKLTKTQMNAMGMEVSERDLDDMITSGQQIQVFTKNHLQETAEAKMMLKDAEDRFSQLLSIEKSVAQVAQLFKDLAVYVDEQGEIIDRIEENVTGAAGSVERGQKNLEEAEGKAGRYRKRKLICYSVLALVILIVIGAIAFAIFDAVKG